jgi:hypothetical protein
VRIEEPGGRDAVTIDPDAPVYQVNIFRLTSDASIPEAMRGYHVYEWKLHDVDAPEVFTWAKDKAGNDPYTVSVASATDHGESHLLRLYGRDPNRGDPIEGCYAAAPDGLVPDMQWFIEQSKGQ